MALNKIIIDMAKYLDAQIGPPESGKKGIKLSTNSKDKLQAIQFISRLLASAPREVVDDFVASVHETAIGHLLYLMCRLCSSSDGAGEDRQVRLESVKLIYQLLSILDRSHTAGAVTKQKVCTSALAGTFLPGVSSALIKLIISDDKLPRQLIVSALDGLSLLITLAFSDCTCDIVKNFNKENSERGISVKKLEGNELIEASENVSSRLAVLINFVVQHRNDFETKLALAQLCHDLITKCPTELISHIYRPVLRYLLAISGSTNTNIGNELIVEKESTRLSELTSTVLDIMSNMSINNMYLQPQDSQLKFKKEKEQSKSMSQSMELSEILVQEFFDGLKHIQFLMKSSFNNDLSTQMSLISGQLSILAPIFVQNLLQSQKHRALIFETLTELCKFSAKTTDCLSMTTDLTNLNFSSESGFEKNLKFLSSERDKLNLSQICNKFVAKLIDRDFYLLFDMIKLDLLKNHSYSPPSLYLLSEILKSIVNVVKDRNAIMQDGCKVQDCENKLELIHELTLEMLDFIEQKSKSNQQFIQNPTKDLTVQYNKDDLQIALAIESFDHLGNLFNLFSEDLSNKIKQIDIKNRFLQHSLCPLLSIAASKSHGLAAVAARQILHRIASHWSMSVIQLIHTNLDYIVDTISLKLKYQFMHNYEVPNLIPFCVKLTIDNGCDQNLNLENLQMYDDIFVVCFKLLDQHYHRIGYSYSLVLMLNRIVHIIRKKDVLGLENSKLCIIQQDAKNVGIDTENCDKILDLNLNDETLLRKVQYEIDIDRRISKLQLQLNQQKQREQEMIHLDDSLVPFDGNEENILQENIKKLTRDKDSKNDIENSEECGNKEEIEKKEDKSNPYHVQLTEKILQKLIHLVSSSHLELRLLALDSASECFHVLEQYQDQLLPLAHQIWPSLLARLTMSDPSKDFATIKLAFNCLCQLARCSRDFIRARTLSQIMPTILRLLRHQARESGSCSGGKQQSYMHTIAYKCQLELLENIGQLVYWIQVSYNQLWPVIDILLLYINDSLQPETLRQASINSLSYITLCDPDAVWYFVNHNKSPAENKLEPEMACNRTSSKVKQKLLEQLRLNLLFKL